MAKLDLLKMMKDSEIQNWLRTIDAQDLKIAVLGMDEDIRQCIFRNMSARAVGVLKEGMKNNAGADRQIIEQSISRLELLLNKE